MRADTFNKGQVLKVMRVTKQRDSAGSMYIEYSHFVSQTTSALIITTTEPVEEEKKNQTNLYLIL